MSEDVFVHNAAEFVQGALRVEPEGSWVRPWRFSRQQLRALSCAAAWHPGLYKQMAACTSGIAIVFETCARKVHLELALDPEPQGTTRSLALMSGPNAAHHQTADKNSQLEAPSPTGIPGDAISVEVDGHFVGYLKPGSEQPYINESRCYEIDLIGTVVYDAGGERSAQPADLSTVGMELPHVVRVQLPLLRGCVLRRIFSEGAPINPVSPQPGLLLLGDSISQGFVAGSPHVAWPRLVADALGLTLYNQGVGGQVVQPQSLPQGLPAPARIVVAFGANYRYEPCRISQVARDIECYLAEIAELWPHVPVWVLTPFWHNEAAWPTHARSCFSEVPAALAAATLKYSHMGLVDGLSLIEHDPKYFADGFEHPNAQGNAQIARRLLHAMQGAAADSSSGSRSNFGSDPKAAHTAPMVAAVAEKPSLGGLSGEAPTGAQPTEETPTDKPVQQQAPHKQKAHKKPAVTSKKGIAAGQMSFDDLLG